MNGTMHVENNEKVREEKIITNIMNNISQTIQPTWNSNPPNFHSKSNLKSNSVSELDVKKEILNLSSKKATRKSDIPAKILKNSIKAYLPELTILINNCLNKGVLPDDLKLADITPMFKKEDSLNEASFIKSVRKYFIQANR